MLRVSLFPCRRSHPARVVRRVSQCATVHAAFTFPVAGSASGAAHFRGHRCVRLRYSLETRHHPADGVVEWLQKVGFPSPCTPSYRALAFPLVGLSPTEHASLRWTHNRTCGFHRIRLSRKRLSDRTDWSNLFPDGAVPSAEAYLLPSHCNTDTKVVQCSGTPSLAGLHHIQGMTPWRWATTPPLSSFPHAGMVASSCEAKW